MKTNTILSIVLFIILILALFSTIKITINAKEYNSNKLCQKKGYDYGMYDNFNTKDLICSNEEERFTKEEIKQIKEARE